MPGILPDSASGGLIRRDTNGNCLTPPGVSNAFCPPATFTTTCPVTALPETCSARITAAQINALSSEMLALAATLVPNGTWNCGAVDNLGRLFSQWAAGFNPGGGGDNIDGGLF